MSRNAALGDLAITLDDPTAGPRHKRLYDALRAAILEGRLGPEAPLPSTRDLAAQLGVARGTVVAVYEQLREEGYIEARAGSGTRVSESLPDGWFQTETRPRPRRVATKAVRLASFARAVEASPFGVGPRRNARPFRAHIPAVDAFPVETWNRLLVRRTRADERWLLGDGDVRGYRPLREALAAHLRAARGVACSHEELVILPSVQQAIDLTARLVLEPGDRVWMEDPGYTAARAVFAAAGATVTPVRVDAHGLDVERAIRRAPDARLAYVTPGHQAPLGVTLGIERRLALLRFAEARGMLVLEDDYDSEYRYEGRPVPALQGLDRAGVVVHVGTFSKTLLPSLRLAYAVVPPALLDAFLSAKSLVDRFTPTLAQATLADFIAEGHFGRHLRRMRQLYAERRSALIRALEQVPRVHVAGSSAGLELAVRFEEGVDDRAIERVLAERGIESHALSRDAHARRDVRGLLLGFAAFSPARLRKAVAELAEATRGPGAL